MDFFSIIENAVVWAGQKIINLLIALSTPVLSPVNKYIPDFNFNFDFINSGFLGFVDNFFPLAYFFSFLVLFLALASTIYIVNWVLGLIPSVS